MAKIHPIERYEIKHNLSDAEFAALIGASRQHVWRMRITGVIGRRSKHAIETATGGEITVAELSAWEPAPA